MRIAEILLARLGSLFLYGVIWPEVLKRHSPCYWDVSLWMTLAEILLGTMSGFSFYQRRQVRLSWPSRLRKKAWLCWSFVLKRHSPWYNWDVSWCILEIWLGSLGSLFIKTNKQQMTKNGLTGLKFSNFALSDWLRALGIQTFWTF